MFIGDLCVYILIKAYFRSFALLDWIVLLIYLHTLYLYSGHKSFVTIL